MSLRFHNKKNSSILLPIKMFFSKHHYFPHKNKKVRAKLLSLDFFSLYSLVVLITIAVLNVIPAVAPGVLGYASDISITSLLENTNNNRISNGLKPLSINQSLSKAAYYKALDMFEDDYWAHISPSGKEPWDFILSQEYDYIYAGENLAKNFLQSKDVVQAWMESPTHRENLLNSNYQEVGFAVVNGELEGYKTTLVVQMFGQPRDQSNIANKDDFADIIANIESFQSSNSLALNNSNVNDTKIENVLSNIENENTQNTALNNNNAYENNSRQLNTNYIQINGVISYALVLIFGFVIGLFVLDIIYSYKHQINKISGHTVAHLLFLFFTAISIWVAVDLGIIL